MRTISCMKCKWRAEVTSNNIGHMSTETGFHPMMTHDGKFHWLCRVCLPAVQEAAVALMTALSDENEPLQYLYWGSLLKLAKRIT